MRRDHNRLIKKSTHIILVIDGSGSMKRKMEAVNEGLREELAIRQQGVDIYFTLIGFSSQIKTYYTRSINPKFQNCYQGFRTVLYDAVVEALSHVKEGEETLIKVFSDGKDYTSYISKEKMQKAIEDSSALVTFMMTEEDENYVVNDLGIEKCNTLAYTNTSVGVSRGMSESVAATRTYLNKVVNNEKVNNFYD